MENNLGMTTVDRPTSPNFNSSLASTPSTIRSPDDGHFGATGVGHRSENWQHSSRSTQSRGDMQSMNTNPLLADLVFKVDDLRQCFVRMDNLKQEMQTKFSDICAVISRLTMNDTSEVMAPLSGCEQVLQEPSQTLEFVNMETSNREQTALDKRLLPLKTKFQSLPALVKGFLTRRLLKTERVVKLKQQITDMVVELLEFDADDINISPAEMDYYERLRSHFVQSLALLYSIFCDSSVSTRMQIIRKDRERIMEQELLQRTSQAKGKPLLKTSISPKPRATSATLKRRERLESQGKERPASTSCTSRQQNVKKKKMV